jgi:hypothetical protein
VLLHRLLHRAARQASDDGEVRQRHADRFGSNGSEVDERAQRVGDRHAGVADHPQRGDVARAMDHGSGHDQPPSVGNQDVHRFLSTEPRHTEHRGRRSMRGPCAGSGREHPGQDPQLPRVRSTGQPSDAGDDEHEAVACERPVPRRPGHDIGGLELAKGDEAELRAGERFDVAEMHHLPVGAKPARAATGSWAGLHRETG